jgi:hypothetical protein
MQVVIQRFTNSAYGFPSRRVRRVKPIALACIHICGNNRTAAADEAKPHSGAQGEWKYASRATSKGPSAHLYVARDGFGIEAIDPARHAAWSNGDVQQPNTTNPGIRRVLAMRARGYNANEAYWEEIENVGGSSFPITQAQIESCALRVATRARISGLPINRETVHGHWEINGVHRQNCPAPRAVHEAVLRKIVARAQQLAGQAPTPQPKQQPKPTPKPSGVILRYGGTPTWRGRYRVVSSTGRQRRSPYLRADNIIATAKRGTEFQVSQTTEKGSAAAGSRRWHGNAAGTIWMHSSVIDPVKLLTPEEEAAEPPPVEAGAVGAEPEDEDPGVTSEEADEELELPDFEQAAEVEPIEVEDHDDEAPDPGEV